MITPGVPCVIELEHLRVSLNGAQILRDVTVRVPRGSCVGVVGESGSGKSMTARAISGLLPRGAQVSGSYRLAGATVDLGAPDRAWRAVRGRTVVWLPQDPFTALDPLRRCWRQVVAGARPAAAGSWRAARHRAADAGRRGLGDLGDLGDRGERRAAAVRALGEVGLPGGIADLYPHQLSGGMRQRVAIAAALAPRPQVLIADEPTTALDAQTRQEVLDLLESLRRRLGLTVVLVTHDLPLARRHADWLAVFQGGEVVEFGSAEQVWAAPRAAHTRELLGAATVGELGDRADAAPAAVGTGADRLCGGPVCPALKAADVVEALRVSKTYPGATGPALRAASIRVGAGEVVGVVGESGSGKTTLARLLLGLERPDSGQIRWWDGNGQPVAWNARLGQLVFQNPFASLNPAMTARAAVAEALAATGQDPERAGELLRLAGLGLELADRKPRQLSGGERQRVAIARALAPGPRLLIADEAVSALDAAVQARVLETLESLRTELGMAVLFISHDLAAVARLADRVYVMLAGEVVESGPTAKVLSSPAHQYTQRLVAAARAGRPERSARW